MRDIKKDIAIISAHIIRFHIVNVWYEQVKGCSGLVYYADCAEIYLL